VIRLAYTNSPFPARDGCAECGGSGITGELVWDGNAVRDRVCACVTRWLAKRTELCCGGLGWQADSDGYMFVCGVCQGTGETVWDV